MEQAVRVRFAPSPTGPLHIGGVRTALFNYLFAKKHNGTFFLRIEDTDQNRWVKGAEEYILNALDWLGISPDETVNKNEKYGPYRQSERKEIYKQYADILINNGSAYYAFDTQEELDNHRKQHEEKGKTFIYNWHNREKLINSLTLSKEEVDKKIANKEEYVIRFKTPVNEILHLQDIIRGEIVFDSNLLDDKVLFKSDGMPTYHLANIVDDYLMKTTHVIRGEEWLPSLPLHYLLYKAFGWNAPQFAHLPLILKPIGNGKLSKRDGDKMGFPIFPLEWKTEEGTFMGYREQGYFPEAVVNFLALLGWNDGTDKELFTLEELVAAFDLNRVNKSGAKFDPEKNKWFNHQYLIGKSDKALASSFSKKLEKRGVTTTLNLERIVGLVKERANFITDLWELTDYFFVAPTNYDEKVTKKFNKETKETLTKVAEQLNSYDDFTSLNIENNLKEWMTANEIGMGKVMQPLRVSLVGELKGPHLFDIIEVLGKEESVNRIEKIIKTL